MPGDRSARAQITVLSSVVFVDLLGLALILPSLPFFVLDLGGGGRALGLILTSYSLSQVVAAPVLGRLSDRYGRRPLLLLSLVGSAASFAMAAVADDVGTLVAARVLAGVCGGSITVAYAYASDITSGANRAGAMGRTAAMARIGAGIGLAFTIGPAIGAALAPLGFAAVCWAGAAIAAVNAVIAWRVLPRLPARVTTGTAAAPGSAPGTLLVLIAGGAVITASFVSMEATVGLLVDSLYDFGPVQVGLLLAAAGLSMTVVQAGLGRRAGRRPDDWRLCVGAVVVVAACLAAIPVAQAPITVAGIMCLAGGYGAFLVTQASLVSRSGPPSGAGARLGWSQGANALGRACGPIGAGMLFDLHPGLPYATAAVLTGALAVALLLVRLRTTDGSSATPAPRRDR